MRLLTLARDLRRRRGRERQGRFVAEGIRAVEELLRSPLAIEGALVGPQLAASPRGLALREALDARGVPIQDVDERDFASAAETDAPQGVLAIAVPPDSPIAGLRLPPIARLVLLDGVQDPGNAGTILRTAAALGAAATIALPGTVDLWNAKVVRSAMGASFTHPTSGCTWDELDRFLAEQAVSLWGADAAGEALPDIRQRPDRLAVAVGNEGSGLSAPMRGRLARLVALPIGPAVESLNVAVATGILLYELRP